MNDERKGVEYIGGQIAIQRGISKEYACERVVKVLKVIGCLREEDDPKRYCFEEAYIGYNNCDKRGGETATQNASQS